MDDFFKNKKILVVAAHPDDELLGLGATMHKLANLGAECHVLILGEGMAARSDDGSKEEWKQELEEHKQNMQEAAQVIGYQSVKAYDFPDNRFDTVALLDIIKVVEKEKEKLQPEVIFTHHGGDLNIDHRRVFEAVVTATRPLPAEPVKTIITFETPSGTEWKSPADADPFVPNLYIEVAEEDIRAKCEAMECYRYERRDWPHPRSAQALSVKAQQLGSVIGTDYAESFVLARGIWKG